MRKLSLLLISSFILYFAEAKSADQHQSLTCDINGKEYYFQDEHQKSLLCDQARACYAENQGVQEAINCECGKLMLALEQSTVRISGQELDPNIIKLEFKLLEACSDPTIEIDPCDQTAQQSDVLASCVLPVLKKTPASIFPPATPLKTLEAIDQINEQDKAPSQFTKDNLGKFLCKTVPGQVERNGTVRGKLVPRPVSEIQNLLDRYISSDTSDPEGNDKFIQEVSALKKHPCFSEVGQSAYFCQAMKLGCKRGNSLRTDTIKNKLKDEFKYSCLQAMCETLGSEGIASYQRLEPFLSNVMQSIDQVRDQRFVRSDRPFQQFCREQVFNKAGAYIPGVELEYPYLSCDETKYKQNSLNIIHGSSQENLKCFSNYASPSTPNASEYAKEMHTAARCLNQYGSTYRALRGVGEAEEIEQRLRANNCWQIWEELPETVKSNAISMPQIFSRAVKDYLAQKHHIPVENAGIGWNPQVDENFENLVNASSNQFANYNQKIRLIRDESLKAQRDEDSCGESLGQRALETIDSAMPLVAGGTALAAAISSAPAVVLPAALVGMYMGVKSANSISERRRQGEEAIDFINNSGITNAYSGVANFHQCAQSSCGSEQYECFDQLYSADKDEFISKMWNRKKCLGQRNVAYAWDSVGVTGGLLSGITFIQKVPTPSIDKGLHRVLRKAASSTGVSENTAEGIGTGLTVVGETGAGISTRLATGALESNIGAKAAKVVDRVTYYDAIQSQSGLPSVASLLGPGKSIPCMSSYQEYEDFYNVLKHNPKEFAAIADKYDLATFSGLCKIPNGHGADDILPAPSITRNQLEQSLAQYCSDVKPEADTTESVSDRYIDLSQKELINLKAQYIHTVSERRETLNRLDRLKIELRNLQSRNPSNLTANQATIDQLNRDILSATKQEEKLSLLSQELKKKVDYLEDEITDSELVELHRQYQQKQDLVEKWKIKLAEYKEVVKAADSNESEEVERARFNINFITTTTLPRLESNMRSLERDYQEELADINQKRMEFDLQGVPGDLW